MVFSICFLSSFKSRMLATSLPVPTSTPSSLFLLSRPPPPTNQPTKPFPNLPIQDGVRHAQPRPGPRLPRRVRQRGLLAPPEASRQAAQARGEVRRPRDVRQVWHALVARAGERSRVEVFFFLSLSLLLALSSLSVFFCLPRERERGRSVFTTESVSKKNNENEKKKNSRWSLRSSCTSCSAAGSSSLPPRKKRRRRLPSRRCSSSSRPSPSPSPPRPSPGPEFTSGTTPGSRSRPGPLWAQRRPSRRRRRWPETMMRGEQRPNANERTETDLSLYMYIYIYIYKTRDNLILQGKRKEKEERKK